jgi:2-iminobutanoate/2-iminopropanoate deaminase
MPKETIDVKKAGQTRKMPFPSGIKKGNHVFVSGAASYNEKGEFVGEGDTYRQTQQTLKNVLSVVDAGGGTLDDIVKVNVFIRSVSDFGEMNRAYMDFFGNVSYPARTTVEANLVREDFLIEIEAEAILD